MADTCKDLDVVAAADDPNALVEAFCSLGSIDVVHSSGEAGARAVTHSGLPVDLRIDLLDEAHGGAGRGPEA